MTSFDPSPKCSTIVELAIRCERSTATGEACAEPADPTPRRRISDRRERVEARVDRRELLVQQAEQHRDGSFGRYDQACSTAFAILALANLGIRGRPILRGQLRLLDWMSLDGRFPPATLFFSSLVVGRDHRHEITFYHDPASIIATAVALSALSIDAEANEDFENVPRFGFAPAWYGCPDVNLYARFVCESAILDGRSP